jgi:hypothetical protein
VLGAKGAGCQWRRQEFIAQDHGGRRHRHPR